LLRGKLLIFIFSLLLAFGTLAVLPVSADEYDDAKVAFGAFGDGLYDFAGSELEQFRLHYPKSKMLGRVRLLLILSSLETGDCQRAATVFAELKKPSELSEFGVDPASLKLRLGNCFLRSGEKRKAQDCYRRLIKENPQSGSAQVARFESARIFFAAHDYVAANQVVTPLLAVLQAAKKLNPVLDRQTVYWIAALSRYQLKSFKSALPLLQVIVDEVKSLKLSNSELQDLYAIIIESAWHCKKRRTVKTILQKWLLIPEKELNFGKLSAALQLAADLLRISDHLADIRGELVRTVGSAVSKDDKIALYGLLIEIDHKKEDRIALRKWLKDLIPLQSPASIARLNSLQSLLLLNFQEKDFLAAVTVGCQLLQEDKKFWQEERFYFPYLSSLNKLGKCREIVKLVPARLPSYDRDKAPGTRRLFLDMMAGNCRQRLNRYADAAIFYRVLYTHYSDSLTRIKLLAVLHGLAARIEASEGRKLDEWISAEVITRYSLDKRENEKLLRESPELVLLVADHFFRAGSYAKAQPSLLWLEKLDLQGGIAERVAFMLAEVYYRNHELAEALLRYQALYENNSKEFRYLAALRLVTIDEVQGNSRKCVGLYKNLIVWEPDPILKAELKRKLEVLAEGER